jgi:hypothetical protein
METREGDLSELPLASVQREHVEQQLARAFLAQDRTQGVIPRPPPHHTQQSYDERGVSARAAAMQRQRRGGRGGGGGMEAEGGDDSGHETPARHILRLHDSYARTREEAAPPHFCEILYYFSTTNLKFLLLEQH